MEPVTTSGAVVWFVSGGAAGVVFSAGVFVGFVRTKLKDIVARLERLEARLDARR